nr:MAG TPA: hypothetical protein [Caudoviricetes sp.]
MLLKSSKRKKGIDYANSQCLFKLMKRRVN